MRLLRLGALSAMCAGGMFASGITFLGPFGPTGGSVIGPPLVFDLQDATLTQPAVPGGFWTLTVDTNYGALLPGPPGNVIPDFRNLAASDFLIAWNGGYYGIVLHQHDGYSAGSLYQASGFQTAGQVLNDPTDPNQNPNLDVWLSGGGSLLGTGTVSAAALGDGITQAEYRITDTFLAPASFLAGGTFVIQMSSADCANGYMTGSGGFPGGGGGPGGGPVPEPGTLWLLAPALLLAFWRSRRTHRAA